MALVVEDGSSKTDANSYLSVDDADAYNTNHTNSTDWSGAETADKEKALRRATQYLDMRFNMMWRGVRSERAQALDWPRFDVEDYDGYAIYGDEIPQCLKDACAELALRALDEEIMPDLAAGGGALLKSKSVKVGPISSSKVYGTAGSSPFKRYTKVDALIRELIIPAGQIVRG